MINSEARHREEGRLKGEELRMSMGWSGYDDELWVGASVGKLRLYIDCIAWSGMV